MGESGKDRGSGASAPGHSEDRDEVPAAEVLEPGHGAEGESDPPQPTSTSAGRSWQVAVPVAMVIAGLIFGVSAATARQDGGTGRPTDLTDLVRQRATEVERLVDRTDELSAEVDALTLDHAPVDATRDEADGLAAEVGATPVTGPAIQVTLDDAGYSLQTLPEGYTVDDVVVHEQDVHAVVNALWAGGAEAMMVQDQRIISTSAVRCVGNTLYLQGRVYSPPYTITAMGDPDELMAALESDATVQNYRAWADILGLGYDVENFDDAEFPAFSGSVRPQYATVDEVESGAAARARSSESDLGDPSSD